MNKKAITGIIIAILVLATGVGGYFISNNNKPMSAPTKTKEPDEEVRVGNDNKEENIEENKSLVVYFSVPETDDPNKKMTTGKTKEKGFIIDNLLHSKKQGYTKDDFFMMSFTGTDDFAGDGFSNLIESLLNKKSNNFIAGTNEKEGNIYFRVKDGFTHDGEASMTYMYNGLLGFYY